MFLDVSHLLPHNPPGLYSGVAVADVDGDGRPEFVVAAADGPNRVLRWTGAKLRDVAPPAVADPDRPAAGVAAGDLDGDGREELYVLSADPSAGPDRLLKAQPDGRWEDVFERPGNLAVRNPATGRGVAAVDRRGVGRYGFFVANAGRPLRLYELGPHGRLVDLASAVGVERVVAGSGVLAAPLFGAHTDLLCTVEHGPNLLFRNRRDGAFEECAAKLRFTDPEEYGRGVAAVDATGDGRLAVCWGNADGPHRLMTRAAGGWKDRATPGLAFPSAVRAVVAADFDNDGHDELFFNTAGEPNRLFRLVANGEFDVHMLDPLDALEPAGHGAGAAVADIDGDGVLELLVAHGGADPQSLTLYKARSAGGNGWLRVVPLTRFGGPARGAAVRAEAGGRVRVKVVCGGSGLSQSEPVAHFGLGPERHVGRVTATWPDGAAVTVEDPGINRTLTVPYPRG
jgi:hypothetical protein